MARAATIPPSKLSRTLSLQLLLLLLLLFQENGAQDLQVRMLPQVSGRLGETVQLPCHLLSPAPEVYVSQVTWLRLDAAGGSQSVAIFHPSYGPSFPSLGPGKERLSFVTTGQGTGAGQGTGSELRDATLAIKELTVEDEGNYTCEFATFPLGNSRGITWLRAIAQPQNHAEAQEVTLSLDPVPVARCVSSGGRPPPHISWVSPHLDGEVTENQVPGPLPGTVTVTSRFTLVPLGRVDGEKVTCKVEHESFEEPTLLPVTLTVRYPPEVSISGYDDNWYLGRTEAALSCDVRSNPEPTGYDWSTTSGIFPASTVTHGPQLIIHSVDTSVNTTFICTVTNAVGTGRAELVVLVRGPTSGETRPVPRSSLAAMHWHQDRNSPETLPHPLKPTVAKTQSRRERLHQPVHTKQNQMTPGKSRAYINTTPAPSTPPPAAAHLGRQDATEAGEAAPCGASRAP
ncbi:nectin-2 isoform X2 [Tamandua tetradactyla]|uniref:nectin-2 isoform X2 n=1 Tax=Tamandua tetradactyla TaxID=48850 RepID=UPI0040541F7D